MFNLFIIHFSIVFFLGKKAAKDASQPSIFSAMSKSKTTSHSDEEIFALDDSPVKTKKSQNSALPTIVSDSDSDDGLSVASSVSAPAFKPKKGQFSSLQLIKCHSTLT